MKRNLIKVGFWKDTKALFDLSGYPNPQDLVDHEWMEKKREAIAQYLDSGKHVNAWFGCSYCRFGCKNVDMGSADLSDCTYLWPEGLSHYIRVHHVRLPKQFAKHILERLKLLKSTGLEDPVEAEKQALLNDAVRDLAEWSKARKRNKVTP